MLDVGRQQGLAEVRGRKLLQLLRPFTTYRRENSKFRGELTLTTGETPRKIIFLDIDGVLHSFDCSSTLFCSLQMLVLKEIVDKTGAGIVLTSNWRRTRAGELATRNGSTFAPKSKHTCKLCRHEGSLLPPERLWHESLQQDD